ncbi:hypothetical protein [Chondromyces crocatus]|uniref:Uncharacterized protein n=1 Tax=Chondromyces crocatus TaxID=52 RepID=A0A0K1ECE3_CHOCO|nr:hypothetical protein [Chondromyces crocatus]AKT38352.1 uncharacterized protein CMC5_024980 [Chondromyces crocatus]
MSIFVTREEIEAIDPLLWKVLPLQIRERLPRSLTASPLNTTVLRRAFTMLRPFLERLFQRLGYEEGEPWPQWKLLAAFYLIQEEVGPATLFKVGRQIYATMPWPPSVRSVTDAVMGLDPAFRAAHHDAPDALIGAWRVVEAVPGRMVIESSTLYPCHLEEGTITGVCDGFSNERPRAALLMNRRPKRDGGRVTSFEVVYNPRTDRDRDTPHQTAPTSIDGPCRSQSRESAL